MSGAQDDPQTQSAGSVKPSRLQSLAHANPDVQSKDQPMNSSAKNSDPQDEVSAEIAEHVQQKYNAAYEALIPDLPANDNAARLRSADAHERAALYEQREEEMRSWMTKVCKLALEQSGTDAERKLAERLHTVIGLWEPDETGMLRVWRLWFEALGWSPKQLTRVDHALAKIGDGLLAKLRKVLSEAHLRHLLESGLSAETILANRFATEPDPEKVAKLLKRKSWEHGPVLVVPYHNVSSGRTLLGFKRVRVDPRDVDIVGAKYLSPGAEWIKDGSVRVRGKGKWSLYFPSQTRSVRMERQPHDVVVLTEGEKKAAYLDQIGFCAIAAPGVDMFRDPSSEPGKRILHTEIADIARGQWLRGKRVVVCFDGDAWSNPEVQRAAGELAGMLRDHGVLEVLAGYPPARGPKGIDDLGFEQGDDAARAVILGASQVITPIATGNDRADLPSVYLEDGKADVVTNQIIAALTRASDVFEYGGALVTTAKATETRPGVLEGAPHIVQITSARAPVYVERVCQLKTEVGDGRFMITNLSARYANMVIGAPCFPGVRRLAGVAATPIVRQDGSIANASGYDTATCVLVDLPRPAAVPEHPTTHDVELAKAKIERLITDFPFAGEDHRAVAIAAMLTPLVRYAFSGPAPLFLFEASTPGSGKSKLARAAGLIGLGIEPSPVSFADDDSEMRKRITSLAMSGAGFVWIDNITSAFGGGSLCAALTATRWTDRVLGQNKTWEGPLNATWCATGNNVVLGADVHRRVALCRMETEDEFPEDRRGFAIKDFDDHVKRDRLSYTEALLTIVRGWIAAGQPTPEAVDGWSDFSGWSRWVREPLVWAGFADPGATRILAREQSDGDRGSLADLLTGFVELAGGFGEGHRLTAGAFSERAWNDDADTTAREALESLLDARQAASPRSVGRLLQRQRDRVFGGMRLRKHGKRDWFVERVAAPEVAAPDPRPHVSPHAPVAAPASVKDAVERSRRMYAERGKPQS